MSRNSIRIWILLSLLLALGMAPFLAQGDQETARQLAANRAAIAQMTLSERDRLERNFEAYKKMSPEKLAPLSEFQNKLNTDRSGEAAKTLELYHEWLETTEPFQRDQLRATTDPQARLLLMNKVIMEQRNREAHRFFKRIVFRNDPERWKKSLLSKVPTLDAQELNTLMQGIEEMEFAARKLTIEQKSELNRHENLRRALLLLEYLKKNTQIRPQDQQEIPPYTVKELFPTFQKVAQQFSSLVTNDAAREFILQDQSNELTPVTSRVQGIIMMSMLVQVMSQQKAGSGPTQQQLVEYFDSLPGDEQDDLLQLEAIEFYKELINRIDPNDQPESSSAETPHLGDVMRVFFSRDGFGRPPERPGFPSRDRDGRPPREGEDRPGFRGGRGPSPGPGDRGGRPFEEEGPFDRNGREPRKENLGPGNSPQRPPGPPPQSPSANAEKS